MWRPYESSPNRSEMIRYDNHTTLCTLTKTLNNWFFWGLLRIVHPSSSFSEVSFQESLFCFQAFNHLGPRKWIVAKTNYSQHRTCPWQKSKKKIYYYKCNKIGEGKKKFFSQLLLTLDQESQPQMKTASENDLMVMMMMMIPFRRKSGRGRPHQQRRKESQQRFHKRRKAFAFFCFCFFVFNLSIYLSIPISLSTFSFEQSLPRKRLRIFHWQN